MPDVKEIWVLGNKSTDADKTFNWDEDIPNITDADVVILDLSTLYQLDARKSPTVFSAHDLAVETIARSQHIDQLHASVSKYLGDILLGEGHIVCLLHHDEVLEREHSLMDMIPLGIEIEKVAKRTKIRHANHRFEGYLEKVESVNYVLKLPVTSTVGTQSNVTLRLKNNSSITDKLDKIVGATFDVFQNEIPRGQLTLLPSILPSSGIEMIDTIVSELRGHASPPPLWVNGLEIAGVNEIEDKIADLESEKTKIEMKIFELKSKKEKLNNHSKLLYATGIPLENAVKTAFVLLGFAEIAQARKKGDEDWKINFKSGLAAVVGVLEVKGVNRKTGEKAIVQCDKWVNNYLLMKPSIKAKGILVANQFRMDAFPESRHKRKCFEPNELAFAKTRNICIIPTFVLFEAVNKVLAGYSPDRNKIEQLMFSTNGVLESILDPISN